MNKMTDKQRELIECMNEFCTKKFDTTYERSKEEAIEYIGKNSNGYF